MMRLSFQYGETRIEFDVVFRKRKTMTIKVEPPAQITAIVPLKTSQRVIIESVGSKAPWIVKKLEYLKQIGCPAGPRQYANGETFMLLGNTYPLQVEADSSLTKMRIGITEDVLLVNSPVQDKEAIKKLVELWYRQEAKLLINSRIKFYQPQIPIVPNRVVIKEQKTRWGSCSSKHNLNYNFKTVMAPLPVLDYIVVHEMCHLVHLNHSREFWNLVESIIPEYRQHKEWLKMNGASFYL
jgi:hypothetical protein